MPHRLRNKYTSAGWPSVEGDTLGVLGEINARVKKLFVYKSDSKEFDLWLSSASEVLDGLPFEDDCDGLAFTVLDLALCSGVNPHSLLRMQVSSPKSRNGDIDHMVAGYEDSRGDIWVLGDTFGGVRRLDSSGHTLKKWARLDTPHWFEQGSS